MHFDCAIKGHRRKTQKKQVYRFVDCVIYSYKVVKFNVCKKRTDDDQELKAKSFSSIGVDFFQLTTVFMFPFIVLTAKFSRKMSSVRGSFFSEGRGVMSKVNIFESMDFVFGRATSTTVYEASTQLPSKTFTRQM